MKPQYLALAIVFPGIASSTPPSISKAGGQGKEREKKDTDPLEREMEGIEKSEVPNLDRIRMVGPDGYPLDFPLIH
jgi:hypothetical protein